MIYQCSCIFYKRDNSPVFVFEVEASSHDRARLLARAECLASGFTLPKKIDVKLIGNRSICVSEGMPEPKMVKAVCFIE